MQILFVDFGGAGKASLIWQEFEVEQDGTPHVMRCQKITSQHEAWPSRLKADIDDLYSFAHDLVVWATGTFGWTLNVIRLGITGDRIDYHKLQDGFVDLGDDMPRTRLINITAKQELFGELMTAKRGLLQLPNFDPASYCFLGVATCGSSSIRMTIGTKSLAAFPGSSGMSDRVATAIGKEFDDLLSAVEFTEAEERSEPVLVMAGGFPIASGMPDVIHDFAPLSATSFMELCEAALKHWHRNKSEDLTLDNKTCGALTVALEIVPKLIRQMPTSKIIVARELNVMPVGWYTLDQTEDDVPMESRVWEAIEFDMLSPNRYEIEM